MVLRRVLAALALVGAPLHAQEDDEFEERAKASIELLKWLQIAEVDPLAVVLNETVLTYREGPEGVQCLGLSQSSPADREAYLRVFFEDECFDIANKIRTEAGKKDWQNFVSLQRQSAVITGHEEAVRFPKGDQTEWDRIEVRFIPRATKNSKCMEFWNSSSEPAKVQSGAAFFCSMLPVFAQAELAPHAERIEDVTFQVENVLSPLPSPDEKKDR